MRRRSKFGWMELAVGVLLIALGIYTFINPAGVLTGVIVIYGALAAVTGAADLVFYVKMERHNGVGPAVALASGILGVFAGILIILFPGAAKWALAVFFPIWLTAHCVSRLTHLTLIRLIAGSGYYYFTLIVSVIGLILGAAMLFQPFTALVSMGFLIGSYLILLGIESIVLAYSDMGSNW